jgi:hypothetical protein
MSCYVPRTHRGKILATRHEVVTGVETQVTWWVEQRMRKLREHLSDTMTMNPFMAPAVAGIHGLDSIDSLIQLYVSAHLMTGHATGFGKLIDEKILPRVFGTRKLDAAYRGATAPLSASRYDEIDHIVQLPGKTKPTLLSLKASRWTIQLSMATALNRSFQEIQYHDNDRFDGVVVGVYYGKKELLTDKYDIVRGINRGAVHDVHDIQDFVSVEAGAEFWTWLNGGEPATQEWVLQGITAAVTSSEVATRSANLIRAFERKISDDMANLHAEGEVKWMEFLQSINGE